MGSSESTGRSNGGENEEEERPTENNRSDITSSIGAAAVAIGTVAVAAWGVSRMLSDESAVKLMKAPGKGGEMIARDVFEANPQQYFANLRGR